MKRLPSVLSLLLFIALCASLAYWLLQWVAPPPRPVAAPPVAQRAMPPLASAANLFGGNPQSGAAKIQLHGLIRSGRAADSIAIIAVEGKPSRALRIHSEIVPGVHLKEVRARTVILSERSGDRELILPEFSAQSGASQAMVDAGNNLVQPQQPAVAVPPVQTAPPAQGAGAVGNVAGGNGVSSGVSGTGASGAGTSSAGGAPGTEAPVRMPAPVMPSSRAVLAPEGGQQR